VRRFDATRRSPPASADSPKKIARGTGFQPVGPFLTDIGRREACPTANVAILLNHLAQLPQATNRLGEAEPLMRRALAIDEHRFGPDHPNVAVRLNNLAALLHATNRLVVVQAEPLMRRALAMDEHHFGPDHPNVALRLKNLDRLLQDANWLDEAEPLMRRCVEILESFTRTTGHEHPQLRAARSNHAAMVEALETDSGRVR
jgi:hypothetical protein